MTERCRACRVELYRHVNCHPEVLTERSLSVMALAIDTIIKILTAPPRPEGAKPKSRTEEPR